MLHTFVVGGIFLEITIVICLAAILGLIFKLFKQPLILAYILAGIIVGPFGQLQFGSQGELHTLAQLGVALLLFMLGLELKVAEFRSTSGIAFVSGIAQIAITSLIGYLLAILVGFSSLDSLYIALALTFSSTIIVVKLLSDKKDIASLYGKIAVGMLLVQDFVAICILMFLSVFSASPANGFPFGQEWFVMKALFLVGLVFLLSKYVFPRILTMLAPSSELLFLVGLAWAFGFSGFVQSLGFTIEIGGFLAGVALANSSQNFQIVARVRSLRDFFITIFFVMLGAQMTFGSIEHLLVPAIVFTAFVLAGKPLIITVILGFLGYRKRTSFFTGLSFSQISEFSFIIVLLGLTVGHVSKDVGSLITLVGIVTFALSTFLILKSNGLYARTKKYLSFLEKKDLREESNRNRQLEGLKDHVVLVGANRMGKSILDALREEGEKILVIDFDPHVTQSLRDTEVFGLLGDISDVDIQERGMLKSAKLIISTVPDLEDNMILIGAVSQPNNAIKVIVIARDPLEAHELYRAGAYYVVTPHVLSGKHLAKMIKDNTIGHVGNGMKGKNN